LASVVSAFLAWAMRLLPILGLARLIANRARIRKALGARLPLGGDWPLWLALVVLALVVGVEIWSQMQ
jgi:hypothetical protein